MSHSHSSFPNSTAPASRTSEYPELSRLDEKLINVQNNGKEEKKSPLNKKTSHSHDEPPWYAFGLFQPPRLMVDSSRPTDEDGRKITWSELFFDLVFVTVIARLGQGLRSETIPIGDYILIFCVVWQQWIGYTIYATRFHMDDLYGKFYVALYMLGIFGAGMHIQGMMNDRVNATGFTVSIIYLRILTIWGYWRVSKHIENAKFLCTFMMRLSFFYAIFFSITLFFPDSRFLRTIFFTSSVLMDLFSSYFGAYFYSNRLNIPLHLHHFIERLGLFVIIVLGESVNGLTISTIQSEQQISRYLLYVACLFGFLLVFSIKLLYFDVDSHTVESHAIKRSKYHGILWGQFHLILVCALGAIGSGLEMMCDTALLDADTKQSGHSIPPLSPYSFTSGPSGGETSDDLEYDQYRSRYYVCIGSSVCFTTLCLIRLMHGGDEARVTCPLCAQAKSRYSFYQLPIKTLLIYIYRLQIIGQFLLSALSFGFCLLSIEQLETLWLLVFLSMAAFLLMAFNFCDEAIIIEALKIHQNGKHEELKEEEHSKGAEEENSGEHYLTLTSSGGRQNNERNVQTPSGDGGLDFGE